MTEGTPPKKRRIIYRANYNRPITKIWVLKKIIHYIIYGTGVPDFVFDPIKAGKHAIHRIKKILLPSFTRKSQEWAYYSANTNSPHNTRFFMYSISMLSEINPIHLSKFNTLGLHLNILRKVIGEKYQSSHEYTYLMERIYKMQKYYWTLRRFIMHCQHKRAKVQIDHDLYMSPLSAKDKNTFTLLQEGKIYYFTLVNLSNIIVNALTHHSMFFMQPQPVKNPYNNVELKLNDLYNIYFKMRSSNYPISPIFSRFFEMNFDINMFKMKYEYDLKNYAVKSYAENATTRELLKYVIEMLDTVDAKRVWEIDEDFPDEILVRELRPFIKLYLFYYYFPEYRQLYLRTLEEKMGIVVGMNPNFGKKKESISRFSGTTQFHDSLYIPHAKNNAVGYLESHKYEERGFNRLYTNLSQQNTYRANYQRWRQQRSTPIVWMIAREIDRGYLSDTPTITSTGDSDADSDDDDADDESLFEESFVSGTNNMQNIVLEGDRGNSSVDSDTESDKDSEEDSDSDSGETTVARNLEIDYGSGDDTEGETWNDTEDS